MHRVRDDFFPTVALGETKRGVWSDLVRAREAGNHAKEKEHEMVELHGYEGVAGRRRRR
jgi:hypothetical protein